MVILNASTSKKRSDKAIGSGAAGPSGISAAVRCAGSRGPTDTGDSPIPIEIAAAPSPTSRGFLHQRLADAGPVRVAACVMAGIRNPSRERKVREARFRDQGQSTHAPERHGPGRIKYRMNSH
jgi:hypothetical protein